MGQSIRIRTELGINKAINVELLQEFDFLEILSLKIQQEDVYIRACADYGVVVGRVTANNGFGIPNARVSIFIPIEGIDESNPIISSIYPYKSPTDKNEDGYRYNLLPYEPSYTGHAATGTLPTRLDVLTGNTAIEIYDKYYKFTAKTNDSGDYMIMGVPTGEQTLVMDVDLSDIGEFSLTPQDLIRMGLATEAQVAGNRFKSSQDLNSLPQIINLRKVVYVSPLWGEPSICQIAINRVDFDLRDEANVDIQPTSVFIGSVYSTTDKYRIRPDITLPGNITISGSKPKDNFGNLCSLVAGPGQILAIRQTVNVDLSGNPILEQYQLEQNGNIIDENGAWMVELPMNLNYVITNEFGEKIISNDPTIGIPTKGKYRFKVKWQQSTSLSDSIRRPYYLVPNVREYGWSNTTTDPNIYGNSTQKRQLQSSYYFGLDWSGYTNGFSTSLTNTKIDEMINCEDTFYQFDYNRVYTVSGLIDQYKSGGRARFIGIKEIDSDACDDSVNKFPVNEGFKNFDLIYFLFSFLMTIIQTIGLPLIVIFHFVKFLWNNFAVVLVPILIGWVGRQIVTTGYEIYAAIAGASGFSWGLLIYAVALTLRLAALGLVERALIKNFKKITGYKFSTLNLPMVQYPDCQACQCSNGAVEPENNPDATPPPGAITQTSSSASYTEKLSTYFANRIGAVQTDENYDSILNTAVTIHGQSLGGNTATPSDPTIFKTTKSSIIPRLSPNGSDSINEFAVSFDLPIGERINVYNLRKKYFDNYNKIKVTFNSPDNYTQNTQRAHYDNTLTVLSSEDFTPGTLLTFVNPAISTDKNFKFTAETYSGIWGRVPTNQRQINVTYATSQTTDTSIPYDIPQLDQPSCAESIVINVSEIGDTGFFTYKTCIGNNIQVLITTLGNHTITNDEGIFIDSLGGDVEFTLVSVGQQCTTYLYPSDIEYYQVITAITVTTTMINNQPVYSLPNLAPVDSNNLTSNPSFWNLLRTQSQIITFDKCNGNTFQTNPTDIRQFGHVIWSNSFDGTYLDTFSTQKVLILQRGVDPYSPTYVNRYGIGKILGHPNEDDVVITANTRFNIPIQKLPTGSPTTVQQHNNANNILHSSYFFTPGVPGNTTPGFQYSSFTTSNVGFYGALDSSPSSVSANGTNYYSNSYVQNIGNGVFSRTTNLFYPHPSPAGQSWPLGFFTGTIDSKYDNSEDLSGGAILYGGFSYIYYGGFPPHQGCRSEASTFYNDVTETYFSPNLLPSFIANPLSIASSSLNIMRTDRLPSSDFADNGEHWEGSVSLLQQNLGFKIYNLEGGDTVNGLQVSTGADLVTADIAGQFAETNVFESLNTCEKMVAFNCYSGDGTTFGIIPNCINSDVIDNGCYTMVKRPLVDLFNGKDFKTFAEWSYRFRFFFALCRGVLSQTFTNNWMNGSLFMFPIQFDVTYNSDNKPNPPNYPKKIIYFDSNTNNFYFRSSPFLSGHTPSEFIGAPADTKSPQNSINYRNLLFPTTIMNLGMKDSFYDEIIFDPATGAYIMENLNSTSYSDNSDIVNLFVISRITNSGFLQQLLNVKDSAINALFTRNNPATKLLQPKNRVDADLVQLLSINNEVGLIPFSPEYYPFSSNNPNNAVVALAQNNNNTTIGIFFSSSTQDLQLKDFITPGVIDFRFNPAVTAVTYRYGIKSQKVPFYQWHLIQPQPRTSIFGSETNNWATTMSDIIETNYQSLDRRNLGTPNYFVPSDTTLDVHQRGYIFNTNSTTGMYDYHVFPGMKDKFIVGAPNQFYFGLVKGASSLDKFKAKYLPNE